MPSDLTWKQGWLHSARHVHSPNFGPRPEGEPVTLVVVHSISLPPGEYGGDEVEQLFTNQLDWTAHPYFEQIKGAEVSAHFFIRRNGDLTQFVSVLDRAWHAGRSSWQGRDNCNDYSVGIELEGLEDHAFELAQYATLGRLILALTQQWPIDTVVGHEHVAPGRKKDPGMAFDWPLLKGLLSPRQNLIPALPQRA